MNIVSINQNESKATGSYIPTKDEEMGLDRDQTVIKSEILKTIIEGR